MGPWQGQVRWMTALNTAGRDIDTLVTAARAKLRLRLGGLRLGRSLSEPANCQLWPVVPAAVNGRALRGVALKVAVLAVKALAGDWEEEYSACPVARGGWTTSAHYANSDR
jgi:hypothetical protein